MTPEPDDRDVDELVERFALLQAGRDDVLEVDLGPATVRVALDEVEHRLSLPRAVLAEALRADDQPLGGGDVAPFEACARLMSVHLDESLATRERHESGWWTYDGGFFQPLPPWEAPRRGAS